MLRFERWSATRLAKKCCSKLAFQSWFYKMSFSVALAGLVIMSMVVPFMFAHVFKIASPQCRSPADRESLVRTLGLWVVKDKVR